MAVETWYLFAYVVGTAFGVWIGFKTKVDDAIGTTIDSLIENGFLRTRKGENGEIEILKYNEE